MSVWKDEDYKTKPYDTICIIGVTKDERRKRIFEHGVGRQFEDRGMRVIEGADLISTSDPLNEKDIKAAIKTRGIDAVLVTRLVSVDHNTYYTPGQAYWTPSAYYHGFYGYYSTAYNVVYTPGYAIDESIVTLETNVYDAHTEKLVWAAVSETFDPKSTDEVVQSFSYEILRALDRAKLIK